MEAGYKEKVDELCDKYSLKGFVKAKGTTECTLSVIKFGPYIVFIEPLFYDLQKLRQPFHKFGICILMSWR